LGVCRENGSILNGNFHTVSKKLEAELRDTEARLHEMMDQEQ
jgi:hypothetical protein